MFEKFLNYIKGAIKKMFSKSTIKDALKIDVAISNDMANAISLWEKMYTNKAPWLNDNVKSLNLAASISNEFARLTTLEMESEITGSKRADFLNEEYKKIVKKLEIFLEEGNATGGLVFKPYVKDNKIQVDFVSASNFYPTEFNSDKEIIGGIFTSQLKKGDEIYTRLEYHKFYEKPVDNISYVIKNVAYKTTDEKVLGNKVNLTAVEEWANIQEEVAIKFVEQPLFAYYKPPIANNIDTESPLGMSVYSRAVDLIEEADRQWGRIVWEYEASEKAVYVDDLATRQTGNSSINVAHFRDRLYRKLNTNDDEFFKEYSPEIRDESLWRGLNKTLQRIEFNVGLAYGTLSEPNTVDKTATEIKSSKQRSYATVSKMQENLQVALEHLIKSIDYLTSLYNLAPQGNYEMSFDWDDSLIVDTEKEQSLQMQEVNLGLRSKVDYIAFRNGLTTEQAQEKLQEIINEKKMTQQDDFPSFE